MFLDLKLKIMHFYRRNKRKVYIALIVIGIVIAVNTYLGYLQSLEPPTTTYEPHNPAIYGDEVTDKNTKTTIEEAIGKYIDYCNEKDYQNAFNCLSDECKEYRFNNDLDRFKFYIDYIFDGKKVYSIQALSNKDNVYVYEVNIMEDMLATGLNNENSELVYNEYAVVTKKSDDVKFAVDGFISHEKMNLEFEDDYMTANITDKYTTYDSVVYKFKVTNKSKYDIVLACKEEDKEFILSLNGDYRVFQEDAYSDKEVIIQDESTKQFTVTFPKYYDETRKETEIIFNKIKVIEEFTGITDKREEELQKVVKAYSQTIDLEQ